jgi:curved DNA-binding protein CbpA
MNPYKTLGLAQGASISDIRQAYFKLVKEYPPERDPEGFKRIRAAYEQLRTEQRRREVDLSIFNVPPVELVTTVNNYLKKTPEELDHLYKDLFNIALGYMKQGWFFTDLHKGDLPDELHDILGDIRQEA